MLDLTAFQGGLAEAQGVLAKPRSGLLQYVRC